MTKNPIRRALLGVSDKTGILELAQVLVEYGVEILSTGGTAQHLRNGGLTVREVADVTRFPEMMDGRVKTLHPAVHGGLLALREDPGHLAAMEEHGIEPIDLLVVNLYPFEETIAQNADYNTCVENIDIGGPAMLRAAAKNHRYVTVITDAGDYGALIEEMEREGGATSYAFRQAMAHHTYARTAAYDSAVSTWFAQSLGQEAPRRHSVAGELVQTLRYGENPHQNAAFYATTATGPSLAQAVQHQGKPLSYNNINDTDAAFELICEFDAGEAAACAIIKHANPCGVALGGTLVEAYQKAFDCDRTSAFGGIVALNQTLDKATAEAIVEIFTEVVIAPDADAAAKEVFARKPNLRLLTTGGLGDAHLARQVIKPVRGGFLLQDQDSATLAPDALRVVTQKEPHADQIKDMHFAWRVAKHVKSNAIVYVKDAQTVGIGAGQMSRVDSTRIAAQKAKDMAEVLGLDAPLTQGSVVASDAFFPFSDGLLLAAKAGAVAIIQPGGSIRDQDVIAAADEAGLAMVFTDMRHFRH